MKKHASWIIVAALTGMVLSMLNGCAAPRSGNRQDARTDARVEDRVDDRRD
jgi:hypothetical protein